MMKKLLKTIGVIGAISLGQSLMAATYCDNKGENSNYEWIESFGGNVSGNNQGYKDFSNLTLTLKQGEQANIKLKAGLTAGTGGPNEYWGVWVDFNQNGIFEASERIINITTYGSNEVSLPFSVPTNALVGDTKMRVIMGWYAQANNAITEANFNPCNKVGLGEVEDYSVTVVAANNGGGNTNNYCGASANSANAFINQFEPLSVSGNNNGYKDFTSLGAVATYNASYAYTAKFNAGFTGQLKSVNWAAWIDYNQNNTFEANEKVGTSATFGTTTAWINFIVPANAVAGKTTMRVVMRETNVASLATPCGAIGFGEVEDYQVNIGSGSTTPPASSYCAASGNKSVYEFINAVGSVITGNNKGYYDHTIKNSRFDITAGQTESFTFQAGFSNTVYKEYWNVWIDFNKDFTFSADEQVVYKYNSTTSTAFNVNMAIPANAKLGETRMRVLMSDNINSISPCGSFEFGEVEDYTVNILASSGGTNNSTYCTSSGDANDVFIDQVGQFKTGVDNGYGDYTSKTINFSSSGLDVSSGLNAKGYWNIWIDFNKNQVFELNERVAEDLYTADDRIYTISNQCRLVKL